MPLPSWTRKGDTFWKRSFDVAVEETTSDEIDAELAAWLEQVEQEDGQAAKESE